MAHIKLQASEIDSKQIGLEAGQVSLADTLSNNAKIANENMLKDIARRGAYGQEYIQLENGTYVLRVKQCTRANLKPWVVLLALFVAIVRRGLA